jgi:hypothetical protein
MIVSALHRKCQEIETTTKDTKNKDPGKGVSGKREHLNPWQLMARKKRFPKIGELFSA